MEIALHAIGIIHSPFDDIEGMPIQPSAARGVRGSIELLPEYGDGLKDLEGFSHLILLYLFHGCRQVKLRLTPFLDHHEHGLFATRAPCRPNPIGLSIVRLEAVMGCQLQLLDVDILNGTPLLDIKPYVPAFDCVEGARCGWLEKSARAAGGIKADGRFR